MASEPGGTSQEAEVTTGWVPTRGDPEPLGQACGGVSWPAWRGLGDECAGSYT